MQIGEVSTCLIPSPLLSTIAETDRTYLACWVREIETSSKGFVVTTLKSSTIFPIQIVSVN